MHSHFGLQIVDTIHHQTCLGIRAPVQCRKGLTDWSVIDSSIKGKEQLARQKMEQYIRKMTKNSGHIRMLLIPAKKSSLTLCWFLIFLGVEISGNWGKADPLTAFVQMQQGDTHDSAILKNRETTLSWFRSLINEEWSGRIRQIMIGRLPPSHNAPCVCVLAMARLQSHTLIRLQRATNAAFCTTARTGPGE